MAVYNTINENINNIFEFIFKNDKLKRYLFYNEDPLDTSKLEPTQAQISLNNLYPYPNNPKSEDNAKSFINIYMFRSDKAGVNNTYQRNARIYVDIICHEELWLLTDGSGLIRPYVILDLLDTDIPKISTPATRGNLVFLDNVYIQYNEKFCGYRLIYEVTNPSKNCG